jgi:uncharacterized protein (TIGR02271 family)
MRQTVVGVFDRRASAQRAVQVLADSGFGPHSVHITDESDAGLGDAAVTRGSESGTDETLTGKIRHFFSDLFGPDDDRELTQYSQALRQGCAVVKVEVEEEARVDVAREALVSAGAVDIEEQAAAGVTSGSGTASTAAGATGQSILATSSAQDTGAAALRTPALQTSAQQTSASEGVIPVVREELEVGKRAVRAGGVRVYSRTVETPVDESVTLREEHAQVERRPVDRAATAADFERADGATIEVRETVEKPVVQKTQRVVEEVSVGKQVEQRTEHIHDTVRSTEVEVENLSGDATQQSAGSALDSGYRSDFASRYGSSGGRYEDYEPAYRYGGTLRGDTRYAGRSWDEFEGDARRDWETAHPGSAWERFKDAIRHGWERATH